MCEAEPADPADFGKGQSELALFVSTKDTDADCRAGNVCTKVGKSLVNLNGPGLLFLHRHGVGGCDGEEIGDLFLQPGLHAGNVVGENFELLILTSGHLTQERHNRCARGGRHAGACETNAGAEASGRAHVAIRTVRAMRPCVGSGRRLCIRRDVVHCVWSWINDVWCVVC